MTLLTPNFQMVNIVAWIKVTTDEDGAVIISIDVVFMAPYENFDGNLNLALTV